MALVSLCASGIALAAPPQSGPQQVTVVNTPLPVDLQNLEIDVYVTNAQLDVVVANPVQVTGLDGGPVEVTGVVEVIGGPTVDKPVPWSATSFVSYDLSASPIWCASGSAIADIPAGHALQIDTVSAVYQTAPAQEGRLRVTSMFQSIDGAHQPNYFLSGTNPTSLGGGNLEWVVNASVSIYAQSDLCLMIETEPGFSGNAFGVLTVSGHLVPL